MRNRTWVWVTVVVVLAVVVAGIGAALLQTAPDARPDAAPDAASTLPSEPQGPVGRFELRQVLFAESGGIRGRPPLRPGPAEGGAHATRDLLRVDCRLKPRPMRPADNVVLCDADGFRYGLGPSALPPQPVASAAAAPGSDGLWVVTVQLDPAASARLTTFTRRLSQFHPPLNQAAIVINGVVVAAPAVLEPVTGGSLQVTGPFSREDAEALAASLGA